MTFRLALHGDPVEQVAWPLFVRDRFPEYETFWQLFVVSLTNRVNDPRDIRFRAQCELDREGRPAWHVAVAQLHYTTLLHLGRACEIHEHRVEHRDEFIEAIVRLSASTDTAFELLGRCLSGKEYDAWSEDHGKKARRAWSRQNGGPLKRLRDYRNCLLHGRVRLEFDLGLELSSAKRARTLLYPTFETVEGALDWRDASLDEFAPADQIIAEALGDVLGYLSDTWRERLIPWARPMARTIAAPTGVPEAASTSASALGATRAATPYSGGSATISEAPQPPHEPLS